MYNLFLDDSRFPQDVGNYIFPESLRLLYNFNHWEVVRSYDEFVNFISIKGMPGMVSFDHDLGEFESKGEKKHESKIQKTGLDCAKWLVTKCLTENTKLPDFLVHSMNPIGSENIKSYLRNFQKFQDQKSTKS